MVKNESSGFWSIENSKEQHLFEMKIVSFYITNGFIDTMVSIRAE